MQAEYKINQSLVMLMEGDITDLDVDAIVNAANAQLILGSGVAGAIHQKGGPSIQEECERIGGTYVGGAVLTNAGNLKAKHVIHAVGPHLGEGDEDTKLRNATMNSLLLAEEHDLKSIAFPAISTGVFRFPVDKCAEIMLTIVVEFLKRPGKLEKVIFCLVGSNTYHIFKSKLEIIIS
jgi:O-acetyl-ADP-ribose deacetylase (regulator of RNase III)